MANITITVQSLLNAAQYDEYTVANTITVGTLKTTIQTATGIDPLWFVLAFNDAELTDTDTLSSCGIVNGSSLRTGNRIAHLSTLEARQVAKLELSKLERIALSDPRPNYVLSQLPTYYSGNDIVDNPNAGGLVEGRPWVS